MNKYPTLKKIHHNEWMVNWLETSQENFYSKEEAINVKSMSNGWDFRYTHQHLVKAYYIITVLCAL